MSGPSAAAAAPWVCNDDGRISFAALPLLVLALNPLSAAMAVAAGDDMPAAAALAVAVDGNGRTGDVPIPPGVDVRGSAMLLLLLMPLAWRNARIFLVRGLRCWWWWWWWSCCCCWRGMHLVASRNAAPPARGGAVLIMIMSDGCRLALATPHDGLFALLLLLPLASNKSTDLLAHVSLFV